MAKHLGSFFVAHALLFSGCAEETLSVGELRCEGTHCASPDMTFVDVDDRELEQIDAGEAQLAWAADLPPCGDGGDCVVTVGQDDAQWVVHADGSVTTARAFMYVPEGQTRDVRSGVSLARFAADGELLGENHDLSSSGPLGTPPAIALAADADDSVLLAMGYWVSEPPALTVYTVAPSLESEVVFELPVGGTPAALATVGEDLLIAGRYGENVELGRYRRKGELRWRQTALLPKWEPGTAFGELAVGGASGIQLAVDGEERSSLLVPGATSHGLAQIDPSGDVADFTWVTWSTGQGWHKAQLAIDGESRPVVAVDAYAVLRCGAGGCGSDEPKPVIVDREREEFYEADVLGMDVDDQDRIYVLTHEGDRSEHRLLVDRLSADLTQRETFVVVEGDEIVPPTSEVSRAHEIRIGPQGEVYVMTPERIGRIELP